MRNERNVYRREAVRDALTGIPNRRSVIATVGRLLSDGAPFGLLFVDIDHFKSVNDTLGHDAGDAALKVVAASLRQTLRTGDHCGRYGGEEFVVLVTDATSEVVSAAAEEHRRNLEKLVVPGHDRRLSASIGVALFDPARPDGDAEELFKRADAALYDAKHQGRNRVVVAAPYEPRAKVIARAHGALAALEGALLKELETGLAGLPLLPAAAAEALRLAENPDTHIAHVARLVERDPPLAARFIALAGSAAYSRGRKLTSMQGALVRIGLAAARDLLLQAVYERAAGEVCRYQIDIARSFEHAVHTAIATRCVTRQLRVTYEHAYVCGLLHDIGEARIYRILARMPDAPEPGAELAELVRRHHASAGADIARAWKLPDEVVDVCTHHHDAPERAGRKVQIVMAAEVLARGAEGWDGVAAPSAPSVDDLRVLAAVGFAPERYSALLASVAHETRQNQSLGTSDEVS
jgi:diguanylate cyclase (GGDEF)-like protein/putative nucleotidyltransferase with HDIG domain